MDWLDEKIHAVKNMTPRKAAKSTKGRKLLEALLCDYGQTDDRTPQNILTYDVFEIRTLLYIE